MADISRAEALLNRAAARTGGGQVVRLARAVCLAVLVEPGLLRRARTHLVPGADPGTESDLWFSPLVLTRNTTGIVLDPDVLAVLRQQLAAEAENPESGGPEFADRARDLVVRLHSGHPPAIRLEEDVVWESVRHRGTARSHIESRLRTAVKAMATDRDGGRAVARWAAQAWWRLPEVATQTDAAQLLAVGTALRLGTAVSVASFGEQQMPASPGWLTPSDPGTLVQLGVELTADGLRFAEPVTGSLVFELPHTSPLVVEIGWYDGTISHREVMAVAPGTDIVLGSVAGQVTLRTLAGRRYTIEPEFPDALPAGLPSPAEVTAPPRTNNLPGPAGLFVGRAGALDQLGRVLADDASAVVSQAVSGLVGVGKSALALQYGHIHLDDYTPVWWITAENRALIRAGLAGLAARLCREIAATDTSVEDAADWAIAWLQAHRGWLLILDDASDPADVEPLLSQLTGGHVLITTRLYTGWDQIARAIYLDVLDPESASQLLMTRTGRRDPAERKAAEEIAAELGYLPLALDQAAAYITQTRITLADYLQRLRRQPAAVYSTESGQAQQTVARVWDITIETIRTRDPAAIKLLQILACYAPDAVPRVILGGGDDTGQRAVDEALGVLASYNMITLTPETVSMHRLVQAVIRAGQPLEEVSVHRLVQAVIRGGQPLQEESAASGGESRLSEEESAAFGRESPLNIALRWLDVAIPDDPDTNMAGWPLLRALLAHAENLAALFPVGSQPVELGHVQSKLAMFQDSQGWYEQALALHESALAIYEATLGPDDKDTAAALDGLGLSYSRLGRPAEALPLQQRALAITETALGPDHPSTAARLDNLATTYRHLGRPAEALPLQQRAEEIIRRNQRAG